MKRIIAFGASSLLFIAILGIEAYLAYSIVPHSYTNKEIHDFMLISMGLAFTPVFVLLAVAMAAVGAMVSIAFFVARICWTSLTRDEST